MINIRNKGKYVPEELLNMVISLTILRGALNYMSVITLMGTNLHTNYRKILSKKD